jgi:hypothetical protein
MKFGFRISSRIKRIAACTSGETDHPAQLGLEGPERNESKDYTTPSNDKMPSKAFCHLFSKIALIT